MQKNNIIAVCLFLFLSILLSGCLEQQAITPQQNNEPIPLNILPEIINCTFLYFDASETSIVQFIGYATDEDGHIAAYHWSFSDGTTSDEQVVIHEFNEPGVYYATLTVWDNQGATAQETLTILVH